MQHKSFQILQKEYIYEIKVTADLYFNMESSPQEDGGGNFIGPLGPYIFTYPWWGLAKWRGENKVFSSSGLGIPSPTIQKFTHPTHTRKSSPSKLPHQIFILPTKGSSHYNFINNCPVVKFQY